MDYTLRDDVRVPQLIIVSEPSSFQERGLAAGCPRVTVIEDLLITIIIMTPSLMLITIQWQLHHLLHLQLLTSRGTLELTRIFPQFTVVQSVLVSDFLPNKTNNLCVLLTSGLPMQPDLSSNCYSNRSLN